jgi:arabinogalactan oligomer/maltooligosaccharide transport system substrate-binding protein
MKRTLAILLALLMVLALVACGAKKEEEEKPADATAKPADDNPQGGGDSPLAGTYDITVWVGEAAVDLTKKQIEDYNNTNELGIKFVATVNGVSEATSADQMLVDVSAGADIYCFAQDQFARLVQGNALAVLDDEAAAIVTAANDPGVVAAATTGDKMYAYPLTSDNGYFMYYDKTVIPEEDVDSLEKLIADCEAAGKYFAFETNTSAWYIASWFFATGCKSEWTTGDNGEFISVLDTFNSPEGLIAVKGMKKLVDSKFHVSSSSGDEFASDAAIVVTGTWNFEAIQKLLGDHMGVTDLPSFEVDGKEYHLGSFNGCKLMGVKPQSDALRLLALQLLAEYLTDYDRQMERFNELSWGPSNLQAQQSDAVQANPGLAALLKQNEYSRPQGQIHGAWWDIAKVIGDDVKAATDEAGLQAALDNYYNKIAALFTMTAEEKTAWGVIGAICGTNWDTDFPMTETEAGVFVSEPLELHAGEEFKVRQGKSWDVNYGENCEAGGANIKVPADGTYTVKLDTNNLTLDLLDANGNAVVAEPEPEPEPGATDTWAVIGAIGDTMWDVDFPMFFNKENNHWYAVVNLKDGAEFKLRANGDWKLNYGLDDNGGPAMDGQTNFKAESGDGAYVIGLLLTEEGGVEISYGKSTWGVIGGFEGSGWGTDFPMTETEPGVYVSEPIALKAGDEFKVRADGDWAVNFGLDMEMGGKNIAVEADGTYIVTLDFVNMTLTFAPAA